MQIQSKNKTKDGDDEDEGDNGGTLREPKTTATVTTRFQICMRAKKNVKFCKLQQRYKNNFEILKYVNMKTV